MRPARAAALAGALCAAIGLAACGGAEPAPAPTRAPTPQLGPTQSSTVSPQTQARIDAARAAYRTGNYQQALTEALEGAKLEPGNAEIRYLTGNAYNQLGSQTADGAARAGLLQNAIKAYLSAVELDPRKDEALTNLATVYYQLGQLDEAQKRIEQALAINPADATSHYVLGTIHLQRPPGAAGASVDLAQKEFEAAIKADPNFSAAYTGLATVYLFRADFKNALSSAQRGVELRGGQQDAFALWALAQAQCAAGDAASGAKTLTTIVAFNVPDARFRAEVDKLRAGCK